MNNLVSVIVPVYNVYKYLPECVDSILNQTYKNIEIILVDDESPDKCGLLCDEYARKYSNVKVVHRKNGGLGFTRNTGLENATGDYVTFIDGDDFVSENHIENLISDLKLHGADACYGGYKQQKGSSYIERVNPLHGSVYINEHILNDFLPCLCGKLDYHKADEVQMSVCMNIYSMAIINRYNLKFHSERDLISEDLIFNFDYLERAKKVCVVDSCEYFYRNTEGSLTKVYQSDRFEKQNIFLNYVSERSKQMNIFNKCEQRIYSNYLAWIRAIIQGEQQSYKKLGFLKSLLNIKNVCNNATVVSVCGKYDETKLTLKILLMHKLIKNKNAIFLWLLSWIKNG